VDFSKSFKLNCYIIIVISRLFSEAGKLLTKQQKRMSPKKTKKLVYIRHEKITESGLRLGIFVSDGGVEEGN